MHCLQSCLFKYITVAAFHIYAQRSEDGALRGGLEAMHYIVMEILLIMEKSRNCVFECLLEPYTSKYLLIFADNRDPETAQSLHGEHKFRLAFSRG